MTSHLFMKISIGIAILLVTLAHQNATLKRMAPSLEDFTQETIISGVYSYEQYGRNIITRIDGKVMYCSVNYNGGTGSCFVPLKNVPSNSRITIAAALIKTNSGTVIYPNSVKVNDREIYKIFPEKSLKEWWFGSRLGLTTFPLILVALYLCIVFVFFTNRG